MLDRVILVLIGIAVGAALARRPGPGASRPAEVVDFQARYRRQAERLADYLRQQGRLPGQ